MKTSTKKAQKAVRAAASVSVPKPPNKPTIMITGSASSHLALQTAAAASRERKRLAHGVALDPHADADEGDARDHQQFGQNRAGEQAIDSGVCEYTQYRMAGTLVGNSRPSEPEEVSRPMEKFSG